MKLLNTIIFIISVLLLTSVGKTAEASSNYSFYQTVKKPDTSKKDKVEYKAQDSTKTDKKNGIIYLYGNAKVVYNGFELNADYIKYDSKNNVIFAKGVKNKNGRYVGRPIFKMGNEGSSIADSLSYNTASEKGLVWGVFTEQEGGFFSGGQAKVQPDQEVHIKGQTFSTCNLPHPHFGIFITKGIATEKEIITGPVYLKIEDIPMPLFLPFGFFPKPNKKSSGFILPQPNQDATRGFSLNGGGYYLAFNDYLDGRITGNIFTNGSYDLTLTSNYLVKYKYNGNLSLNYSSQRNGLEGTPEFKPRKVFNIGWSHTQNAMAHPGTTFSALVNAGSSTYFSSTAANQTYDINQIASNTLSSSIAYGKVFGDGLFNLTAALSHSQETQAKTVTLTLPQVSLNMSTINPFDSKDRVRPQRFYEKITIGYSMQASNTVSTREDLLFDKNALKRFRNGFSHLIPVSLPFSFKYFQFNANGSYNERWYFQSVNQRTIRLVNRDSVARDTVGGFKRSGEYNIGMGLSTKIYATKQFKNFGNIKGIRHIITPTVNFSYKPDFSKPGYGYYKPVEYYTNDIRPGKSVPTGQLIYDQGRLRKYSIFESAVFGGPSANEQANLGFTIDNNVELKIKSKKDTTNGGERKLAILQNLTISGQYNFIAPVKKLTPLNFSGRSQLTEKFGINFNGTLNPYQVRDSTITYGTGEFQTKTLQYYESNSYAFPRLTNFSFSLDYSFNSQAVNSRNNNMDQLRNQGAQNNRTPEQLDDLAAISRDPNAFVDFNIPWNIAFSYNFNYTNQFSNATTRNISNTLNFNGDFNITPKWKIQFTSGWDFKAKDFSYTSFNIYRDLHCWSFSASWIPFGAYQSYSVTIAVLNPILQDLKLSKRKGFYTRY